MKTLPTAFATLALVYSSSAAAQNLAAMIQNGNEQLLNRGNLAVITDMFAANYVAHDETGTGPGVIRKFITDLRTAFPDIHVEVQVLSEQGNRITWLRTARGTQRGAFMGVPASGRTITWQDMVVTRYEGGKVAEEWAVTNLGERLRGP